MFNEPLGNLKLYEVHTEAPYHVRLEPSVFMKDVPAVLCEGDIISFIGDEPNRENVHSHSGILKRGDTLLPIRGPELNVHLSKVRGVWPPSGDDLLDPSALDIGFLDKSTGNMFARVSNVGRGS